MSDSRPRPQYGEYASQEDQAKAIRVPLPTPPPAAASTRPPQSVQASRRSTPVSVKTRRSRDTVVTVVLLAIGLLLVVRAIPGMADLPATIDQTAAMLGYRDHYAPVALASAFGLAINITQVALWLVTCSLSILALRRHRLAFYIPIVGGVVAGVVVTILMVVAMLSDPALVEFLMSSQA